MSKGLRKALIAVVLIAAALYAGAKFYVRSEADAALSEAEYALREVVRLNYDGFSAGLDGSVTLHELTATPSGGGGEIFIRNLTVAADSLGAALGARRSLAAGRLPEAMTVTIEDLRLNFDSDLYRRLNEWSGRLFVGTPLDHLACGDIPRLDAAILEDMGFDHFGANGRIRFNRGTDERAALVAVELDAPGSASLRTEAVLRSPEGDLVVDSMRGGAAGLGDADVRYRDDGYFDARNYYCAARRGDDVDGFLAAHEEAAVRYLRRHGVVPSEALRDAYMRLIGSPGNEVRLSVSPEEPLVLGKLGETEPATLVAALHPAVAVNGEPVEDITLRWVQPSADEADEERTAPARFHAADPQMLERFVGSLARLVTYDGKVHEGEIMEASGSRVTMKRHLKGGDMSFAVPIGDIKSAEIYRRQPVPPELQPKQETEADTGEAADPSTVAGEAGDPESSNAAQDAEQPQRNGAGSETDVTLEQEQEQGDE